MSKTDRLEGWLSLFAFEIIHLSVEGAFSTQTGVHLIMRKKAEELQDLLKELKDEPIIH